MTATATSSAKLAEVDRSRTAAATAARRRQKAQRQALELAPKVGLLDDEWVARLAHLFAAQCELRGVAVWSEDD